MDQIKAQKLQTMNYYKNSQFLYNLILSSLVAITCSLFCSHPFWFASLTSSIKYYIFISLPNIWSSFLNPKCLFIVFNVIVAFLVGESKLLGSQSSPANDIHSEYVEMSRSLRGQPRISALQEEKKEEKKVEMEMDMNKESENIVYEDKEVLEVQPKEEKHDKKWEEAAEEEEEEEDEKFQEALNNDADQKESDGEEESDEGLPTEELNRRVEAFIARINKQRWLEARMLICSQA